MDLQLEDRRAVVSGVSRDPQMQARQWGRIITISGLAARSTGSTPEEVEQALGQRVTIGRLVTAAEVADVVCCLASPRRGAITGDVIPAGGGSRGSISY